MNFDLMRDPWPTFHFIGLDHWRMETYKFETYIHSIKLDLEGEDLLVHGMGRCNTVPPGMHIPGDSRLILGGHFYDISGKLMSSMMVTTYELPFMIFVRVKLTDVLRFSPSSYHRIYEAAVL